MALPTITPTELDEGISPVLRTLERDFDVAISYTWRNLPGDEGMHISLCVTCMRVPKESVEPRATEVEHLVQQWLDWFIAQLSPGTDQPGLSA
jgi:hypothetical protein